MQIFISYSRSTPYFAESLKQLFEDNSYQTWLDVDDIQGGAIWEGTLLKAIEKSFVIVVVVTKQALKSEWIAKEISVAKAHNRNIIPLIMERLEDIDSALKCLEISEYQMIDFVSQRKSVSEEQLLIAIENNRQTWLGVIPNIQKLTSDNKVEQVFGIRQIRKLGEKASSASIYLFPYLKHPDWDIRSETVEALVEVGDETAVLPLIELIRDGMSHPAYLNRFVTSNSDSPSVVKVGDLRLGWTISSTINLAILALGWIGSPAAAPFLREQANDGNPLAITSLGYLRDQGSVQILTEILDKSWRDNLITEFACIWALGRIGAKKSAKSVSEWLRKYFPIIHSDDIEYYEDVKGTYDKNAYYLWDDLDIPHHFAESFVFDNRINVVKAAIIVLGKLRNTEFLDTLLEILKLTQKDESSTDVPDIQNATIFAIGLMGSKEAIPMLEQLEYFYQKRPTDSDTIDFYPLEFVTEAISLIEAT